MGYYTRFELSWSGSGTVFDKFNTTGADEPFGAYDVTPAGLANQYYDTMKWYSWEKDLNELSAKWPTVLFKLQGEGEESGDIWVALSRNGKAVTCQARIEFDIPENLDERLPYPDDADLVEKERRREEIRNNIYQLEAELKKI